MDKSTRIVITTTIMIDCENDVSQIFGDHDPGNPVVPYVHLHGLQSDWII